jgi:serine/threonine-protein kinase ATR
MIEAMGILGIEGPFRKCCEITLRILQREKNTLMSYLTPFLYDPMIASNMKENSDRISLKNQQCIEKKLKGVVRRYNKPSEVPLSIEGHVNMLINEATSDENLSQMYFPWSPFI